MTDDGVGLVWSLYDDIKREILRLYGVFCDSVNNYRMHVSLGKMGAAQNHYLTAGKALRKMTGLCTMSGAWPRNPEGLERLHDLNAGWFGNGRDHKEVLKELDFIEEKMHLWFSATHFFDIRVDSGRRGVLDVSHILKKAGL
ncbi:MAG: hypothetical protein LC650_01940 [Actinobacteria bacterium]|nr:hypothetical protein [Actinomycetota bacterium]